MSDQDELAYLVACSELERAGSKIERGTEPDTAPEVASSRTNQWRRIPHDTGEGD